MVMSFLCCLFFFLLFFVFFSSRRRHTRSSTVSWFFFQAEDGIRDLVRSRGLGDVYKRQAPGGATGATNINIRGLNSITGRNQPLIILDGIPTVSYTHLTLPMSDLV